MMSANIQNGGRDCLSQIVGPVPRPEPVRADKRGALHDAARSVSQAGAPPFDSLFKIPALDHGPLSGGLTVLQRLIQWHRTRERAGNNLSDLIA